MRLLTCEVTNFGSYSSSSIDFQNAGLALIYGTTGSGKSTLQDMCIWVMFGITAKGGSVDDVRNWQHIDEPTTGVLGIELLDTQIEITRIRGKASQNDLYWTEQGDPTTLIRGKDLAETQKLLEKRLGVSSDLYIAAAYFHEFSPTGTFFSAKAKDRRAVFEGIADLDLAQKLGANTSETRKEAKKLLAEAETSLAVNQATLKQLSKTLEETVTQAKQWEESRQRQLVHLTARCNNFEEEKAKAINALQARAELFDTDKALALDKLLDKLETLDSEIVSDEGLEIKLTELELRLSGLDNQKCETCGGPVNHTSKDTLVQQIHQVKQERLQNDRKAQAFTDLKIRLQDLQAQTNPTTALLDQQRKRENFYRETMQTCNDTVNPFNAQLAHTGDTITTLKAVVGGLTHAHGVLQTRVAHLSKLYDLSFELRGELLKKAVSEVETATNRYLETYFDAEIKINFSLDGDSLEVAVEKGGYACNYKQLSKGQRQLLKLSFSVAMMAAASNKCGIHFANCFFDEALDGLDAELKIKAYGLFQELAEQHETVLLIDHAPEFQNMFAKRYHVTLEGDDSCVEVENEQS